MIFPESREAETRVRVTGSLAVELFWALGATRKKELLDSHPAVAAAYDMAGLGERIASFWDDDLYGFVELIVLAHHAGVLADPPGDLPGFLDAVGRAFDTVPTDLALATESDAERSAILHRLGRLRRSRRLRTSYLELLSDLWSGLEAPWRREGRDPVERSCARTAGRVGAGDDWFDLIDRACTTSTCAEFRDLLHETAARTRSAGGPVEVVLVHAAYSGKLFILDLPGTYLAALPTSPPAAAARRATEELARRLRAVADPTRLAILDRLTERPHVVGELASAFGLAQPTVSNHVKVLREAGLVDSERRGTRRELVVDRDGLAAVLDELGRLAGLVPAAGSGHVATSRTA